MADFDWPALRAAWVADDPYQPEPGVEEHFRTKYEIAARLQPTSICEIGVRAGYSALAFLQAVPRAAYLGIDLDEGTWGGISGYLRHAVERLRPYRAEFMLADSQRLAALVPQWEFWHIDGDHSAGGALHDLVLADASGARWMLLDDYDFIPHVRIAGDQFAWEHRDRWTAEYVSDGGYRGNLLLSRKAS